MMLIPGGGEPPPQNANPGVQPYLELNPGLLPIGPSGQPPGSGSLSNPPKPGSQDAELLEFLDKIKASPEAEGMTVVATAPLKRPRLLFHHRESNYQMADRAVFLLEAYERRRPFVFN